MEKEQEKKVTPITAKVKKLENRINRLEAVIAKMAHYSGNNRILVEHQLEPWTPGKKDMTKFKDA